jgi:hypothetical protein
MIKWRVQRNRIEDKYVIQAILNDRTVRVQVDGNVKSLAQTRFIRKQMVVALRDDEAKLLSRSWYQKLLDWVRGY